MNWHTATPTSNQDLVNYLQRNGLLTSSRVRDAMLAVDRANYCLPETDDPYEDSPQQIGHAATISAPHMHAEALEQLKDHLVPGARILDVGSGSGYLVACMAQMVQPGGKVYGVEHIPELVEFSKQNLRKRDGGLLDSGIVELVQGDGYQGLPAAAPFQAIHVGAAARELPQALVDQLAPGGRMIIPVGPRFAQELLRIDKDSDGRVHQRGIVAVRFVPLTTREKQEQASTQQALSFV